MKKLTANTWGDIIPSGGRIFIGSAAGCPQALVYDMLDNAGSFRDVEVIDAMPVGRATRASDKYSEALRVNAFFLNEPVRQAVEEGRADYTPCSLFDAPRFFSNYELPLDVALIQVCPPDEDGYCSLGVSVDVTHTAQRFAQVTVAQINPQMPRTRGHAWIHKSDIDYFLEMDEPLIEFPKPEVTDVIRQIGSYVSTLIQDGDTLQLGFGPLPQALMDSLTGHRHLGIHTDMLGDAVMECMKSGIVDNSLKTFYPNVALAAYCLGSRELYEFINDNDDIEVHPAEFVNDPSNIAENERMVAINSAIEVDLSGQVAADSVGKHFYSGIGSQVDFIRGASQSRFGHPIIALPSTTKDGKSSRILGSLQAGTGVVTSRADANYVVTEYGIATMHGRSIRERVLEMIQIAHPKFRDQLLADAKERHWIPEYHQMPATVAKELGDIEIEALEIDDHAYVLRPLHPSDVRHLQEFFYSAGSDLLRRRYGYRIRSMPREKAYRVVNVDQAHDLALGIFKQLGGRQVIRAHARFYRSENDPGEAECALVVNEGPRQEAMCATLLDRLIKVAAERGVQKLTSVVKSNAEVLLDAYRNAGAALTADKDSATTRVEIAPGG